MNYPVVQSSIKTELLSRFDALPVLDKDQEYDLACRLKENNDLDAAQMLISANLRNVVHIAMNYTGYGLPMEDIVQEGTMGLMVAVKKFDPKKGYRLMTYATWWIKAMIHDYIMKFSSSVKIGTTKLQKKLFYGLNRMVYEENMSYKGIKERSEALSARLDADPGQIEEIIARLTYKDQSLNSPTTDDGNTSFMDFLADTNTSPEDKVIEKQRAGNVKKQIDMAIGSLSEREQVIARQRLMAETPSTLEDLGRQYNISKERVRQIEASLKIKLKKNLEVESMGVQSMIAGY
ncbi:MAG: RNA polymerase factor sigma-32 [Thermodesulfobacteriota bacterium]|nr:RNA polymerase factor sigma-32 [Thermodesulfobacteriota bacterium]